MEAMVGFTENPHLLSSNLEKSSTRKRKREGRSEGHTVCLQEVPHPQLPWIDLSASPHTPLPPGWEQCLDLQSGEMYFVNLSTQTRTLTDPRSTLQQQQHLGMRTKGLLAGPLGLDLEAKLAYAHTNVANTLTGFSNKDLHHNGTPNLGNGCVSNSNLNLNMAAMVCLHCHTFVMVSKSSPHCPKCKNLCNVDLSVAARNHQM